MALTLSRADVHRLHEEGLLTAAARDAALDRIRRSTDWPAWLRLRLLFLGAALLLSGIVFFFAFNWADLGRFARLGVVEGGLAVALAGALLVGPDRLGGRVLLLAANVMVGVVLAVVGQVYQTGADMWELFAAWSALTVLWVALSKFAGHWILWLAVTNTAAILWWEQMLDEPVSGLCLILAILDGLALAAHEIAVRRRIEWASAPWVRQVLWTAVLVILTIPPCILIFAGVNDRHAGPLLLPASAAWVAAVPGGWFYYRRRARDLGGIILAAMSLAAVAIAVMGKVIFEQSTGAIAYFVFGVGVLAVVGGLVVVLWKEHLALQKEPHA